MTWKDVFQEESQKDYYKNIITFLQEDIDITIIGVMVIECIENKHIIFSEIFDNDFNQLKWSDYVY
jgi:hypothetical protein